MIRSWLGICGLQGLFATDPLDVIGEYLRFILFLDDVYGRCEWWPDVPKVDYNLKPHQPGNNKNRAGSMAMWVAPIRVYNHLSREIPFVS